MAVPQDVEGNDGALPIDVPRDRDGSFEPELDQEGSNPDRRYGCKIIASMQRIIDRTSDAHLEEGLRAEGVCRSVAPSQMRSGGSIRLAEPALEPMYPLSSLIAPSGQIRGCGKPSRSRQKPFYGSPGRPS